MVWGACLQALIQKKPVRMLSLTACVTVPDHGKLDIYDTWALEKIIYDDGIVKVFEKGNFVQIHKDYMLEIIAGYGNRRYPYTRKNNILSLTSGNEIITWEIVQYRNHELQIKTPIGLYILKR